MLREIELRGADGAYHVFWQVTDHDALPDAPGVLCALDRGARVLCVLDSWSLAEARARLLGYPCLREHDGAVFAVLPLTDPGARARLVATLLRDHAPPCQRSPAAR